MSLTFKQVQIELKQVKMTIRLTRYSEFRVNKLHGKEDTAYYTEHLDDALNTGKVMSGAYLI